MRKAFTLIELLVVIAIVGILIAILVLAIGGATGLSQSNVCKINQKQLIFASVAYLNEHGHYVPAVSYVQEDGVTVMKAWDDEDMLWQYVDRRVEHMVCPEHIINTGSMSGYNYNTSFIGDEDYMFSDPVKGVAASDCKHPAHCALFGDCAKNKFMRCPEDDPIYDPYTDDATRCAGTQTYRHVGSTNVGWLDGHVSSTSVRHNPCNQSTTQGFLSEDNSLYDPRILNIN